MRVKKKEPQFSEEKGKKREKRELGRKKGNE